MCVMGSDGLLMYSVFFVSLTVPCGGTACTVCTAERWQDSTQALIGFVNCCLQRDLFSQLMVHAAMKSEKKRNRKLGRCVEICVD